MRWIIKASGRKHIYLELVNIYSGFISYSENCNWTALRSLRSRGVNFQKLTWSVFISCFFHTFRSRTKPSRAAHFSSIHSSDTEIEEEEVTEEKAGEEQKEETTPETSEEAAVKGTDGEDISEDVGGEVATENEEPEINKRELDLAWHHYYQAILLC